MVVDQSSQDGDLYAQLILIVSDTHSSAFPSTRCMRSHLQIHVDPALVHLAAGGRPQLDLEVVQH